MSTSFVKIFLWFAFFPWYLYYPEKFIFSSSFLPVLFMYTVSHTHAHTHKYIYIYIVTWYATERERERWKERSIPLPLYLNQQALRLTVKMIGGKKEQAICTPCPLACWTKEIKVNQVAWLSDGVGEESRMIGQPALRAKKKKKNTR